MEQKPRSKFRGLTSKGVWTSDLSPGSPALNRRPLAWWPSGLIMIISYDCFVLIWLGSDFHITVIWFWYDHDLFLIWLESDFDMIMICFFIWMGSDSTMISIYFWCDDVVIEIWLWFYSDLTMIWFWLITVLLRCEYYLISISSALCLILLIILRYSLPLGVNPLFLFRSHERCSAVFSKRCAFSTLLFQRLGTKV